jgi:hypothetical protein
MPTPAPIATSRRIFISYSRAQYYFAEDLAAALSGRGFDVWFDAERLLPGSDWQGSIEAGIRVADVLVIVGSREAFASDHVAGELRSALEAGKRLVVALFESTRLPEELASQVAVADFRSSWRAGMDALARMLERRAADGNHAAIRPLRRKTWSVNVVLGAFAALIAYFGFIAVADAFVLLRFEWKKNTEAVVLAGMYAASVGTVLVLRMRAVALRRFRRRRALMTLLMFGVAVPLAAAFSFDRISLYAVTTRAPELANFLGGTQFALAMAAVSMACIAALLLYRSRDFRRWLPTGEGRDALGALTSYLPRRALDAELAPASDASFRLRGENPDRAVMDLMRREFQRFGLREAHEGECGATTVLVISRNSTLEAVVRDIPEHAPVLPVIVSNDVDGGVVNRVSPFQWVDYRRRHRNTLRAMARRVRDGLQGTQMHPHDVIPEKLSTDVFPRHVSFILLCIRAASAVAIWVVIVAAAMLAVLAIVRVRETAPAANDLSRMVALILGLADLFVWWDASEGLFTPLFEMSRSGGGRAAGLGVAALLLVVPISLVAVGNGLRTGAVGQRAAHVIGAVVVALGVAGLVQALIAARSAVPEAWLLSTVKVLLFAILITIAGAFLVLMRRCAWLPAPSEAWHRRLIDSVVDRKGLIAVLRTALAMYFFFGGAGFLLVSMISF